MFTVVSNYSGPIPAASLHEAQMIMWREYNLKLADIIDECPIANPKRGKSDEKAWVTWKGKTYQWHIEIAEDNAA